MSESLIERLHREGYFDLPIAERPAGWMVIDDEGEVTPEMWEWLRARASRGEG